MTLPDLITTKQQEAELPRFAKDVVPGTRIGLWTVVGHAPKTIPGGIARLEVACDCGTIKTVRYWMLKAGQSRSCRCAGNVRHGMAFKGKKTRLYNIWSGMRFRCENPRAKAYPYYGGRGISVCERWKKFDNFKVDMEENYAKHVAEYGTKETTIDRIDNRKGYSLENCRWATYAVQAANKRHRLERFSSNEQ